MLVIIFILLENQLDPLLLGIGFLEREPRRFECRDQTSNEWRPCSKEEICGRHLSKDQYKPVKDDDEYFDNWVE